MRRRRSERFEEQVGEIFRENTFGGSKYGEREKPKTQQMPILAREGGIKLEWDNRVGEYPTTIALKMTDGEWVRYQIVVEQPEFSPALVDVANMQQGYPRRKS